MKTRITRSLSLKVCLLMTGGFCCFVQAQQGKEQAVEVPFDFYRNEIIVQVTVNGKGPFSMMLDTGTDPSVVDLARARETGLKLDPVGKL